MKKVILAFFLTIGLSATVHADADSAKNSESKTQKFYAPHFYLTPYMYGVIEFWHGGSTSQTSPHFRHAGHVSDGKPDFRR